MRNRIVVWGADAEDKKQLLALELREQENKVDIYSFPAEKVTEDFYTAMMNDWRKGKEVEFPEGGQKLERELSQSESLLPDELKTKNTDFINETKAKWHFVVLSSKLRQSYQDELNDIKEKLEGANGFSSAIWDELKEFWSKIQRQISEENLFREHAYELKDTTNALFTIMKGMRKKMNEEFSKNSKEFAQKLYTQLDEVEEKIDKGLGLQPLFERLKQIQREFNQQKITSSDRNSLWKRIDGAFKNLKEKKYGSKPGEKGDKPYSPVDRINSRIVGLTGAIERMEKSIEKDKKDIEYHNSRGDNAYSQLELQLKDAKLAMIAERRKSKETKLEDMHKTLASLQKKLTREEKYQKERERKQQITQEKDKIKDKIASEIEANKKKFESDPAIAQAASVLQESKIVNKTSVPPVKSGEEE